MLNLTISLIVELVSILKLLDGNYSVENFSTEDICIYSEKSSVISQGFLEALKLHEIDGGVLLELTDEHLHELAPLLGDRIKIKKLIHSALSTISQVSFYL